MAEELAAYKKYGSTVYVNVSEIGAYVNSQNQLITIEKLEEVVTSIKQEAAKLRAWAEQYAQVNRLIEGQLQNLETWAPSVIMPKLESPRHTARPSRGH